MLQNSLHRQDTTVLVVGAGGTFGSSSALHLLRSGYSPSNIQLLDSFPIPSRQSAGYDMNKLFGRQGNAFEAKLSEEAYAAWTQDALFKPYFHETGRVTASSSAEGIAELQRQMYELQQNGLADDLEWLSNPSDFLAKVRQLEGCNLDGWSALRPLADGGWMAAKDAIAAVGRELVRQHVKMSFGNSGAFKKLILSKDGTKALGVETEDGSQYFADKIVLAAGAYTAALVDLEGQCVAKAWVYGHIKLDPKDVPRYKNMPPVYNGEVGFFFEPNDEGIVKLCDEFSGFTHFEQHQPFGASKPILMSVPRTHAQNPSDSIPNASRDSLRRALATYLPGQSSAEMFNTALCWCADTADGQWLLSEHPRWQNLYVATGDSGSSFKHLPIVGKYIVQLLEGSLPPDLKHAWRWRPGIGPDPLQGRRAAPAEDLANKPGWRKPTLTSRFKALDINGTWARQTVAEL